MLRSVRSRYLPVYLMLLCAGFAVAGVLAIQFPETPGTGTASVVSTVAIAVPAILAVFWRLGLGRAALSLAGLSLFAFGIETLGAASGWPYGEFSYSSELGPKIADLVPYVLPVSYVPLVIGAAAAAELPGLGRLPWVLGGALLLVAIDGVLDPGAAAMGLWVWPEGGAYYGVPASNYFGWLVSSIPAVLILLALGGWWGGTTPHPAMLDSAIVSLAFWTAVSASALNLLPVVLGVALLALFLRRRRDLSGLREKGWRSTGGWR